MEDSKFSEYARYIRELRPLLENVSISELTDDDVEFLTGETGIPTEHLRFLKLDASWSKQHGITQAIYYGLFRQNIPTDFAIYWPKSRVKSAML